ncbi:MAG: glycosyltransferase [Streptosporangiales bacterium]|nr:glycosyltransferase [Streptosporangiales bacterium]
MTGHPTSRRSLVQPRWTLITTGLLGLLSLLLVNGLAHGTFSADARVAPPASVSHVPDVVHNGGPIVDTTGGEVRTHHIPRKTMILTFDDGPDPEWTPRILEVLHDHHVPGTFFVVGSLASRYPGVLADIRESGSELGVHTFSHPDLAYAARWRIQLELAETQLAIAGGAGVTTSLMRPPYSSEANAIDNRGWPSIREIGRQGYTTVLSTLDTQDWRRPGVREIVRSGTPRNGNGESILLHDGGGNRAQTVAALEILIPRLLRQGYRFTTLGELMHDQTANPAAGALERLRGEALLTVVQVAKVMTKALAGFLLVAGVLVVARLLAMLVLARRHAASARRRALRPPTEAPRRTVSVVVPAYNERECIAATVRSIVASEHPVEVIVVDDGSTDGTAEVAERLGLGNVRVIRRANGGKPSALNAGIAAASSDLIVMVDGDTTFAPQTVSNLVRPFADPRIGAVAGNVKVGDRRNMVGLWQHIEYVIGFNIDRRVYDVLHACPPSPARWVPSGGRPCCRSVVSATTPSPRTPTSPWRSAGPAGGSRTSPVLWPAPRRRAPWASCGGSATDGATAPCSRCGSTGVLCWSAALRDGSDGSVCSTSRCSRSCCPRSHRWWTSSCCTASSSSTRHAPWPRGWPCCSCRRSAGCTPSISTTNGCATCWCCRCSRWCTDS